MAVVEKAVYLGAGVDQVVPMEVALRLVAVVPGACADLEVGPGVLEHL